MNDAVLVDYLRGKKDENECRQIELWCDETPENRKILEQLYCTLFVVDSVAVMEAADTEASLQKLKIIIQKKEETEKPKKRLNFTRRYIIPVAVAFLAGVIITGAMTLALLSNKTVDYSVTTSPGQRAQTVLPDGSQVWLNASTDVTYRDSFWSSNRQVYLSGEAYFEVAHNKNIPFTVNGRGMDVSVLGTKFNMRARETENNVVTTLFEGSVLVSSPQIKTEYLLTPGQTLYVNATTNEAELLEYAKPIDVLLWIDGRLEFKNNSLLEITSTMEKLYDIRFIFEDETLKLERFTGEFSTDRTPEDILKILTYTNYFSYKREGQIIYLMKINDRIKSGK